ncbi:hypothetical protein A2U01_0082287, partial [Trifolium medium]|nr:hypothetical protein [Trifolium medium]
MSIHLKVFSAWYLKHKSPSQYNNQIDTSIPIGRTFYSERT